MRKVLPMSRIREMEPYMDAKVLDYIHEGRSFPNRPLSPNNSPAAR